MNVLEKILEEIRDNAKLGNMRWESIRIEKVEEIIRSYMSEKEKVSSAEIISWNIDGKPYYGIKFKKVGEDDYTVGYGSYKLDYVINWLNECFEFYSEVKVSVNVAKDTNVPSNDGWIPVEERLPNQNGVYNVTRLVDDAFIYDSAYFDGQDTWHNDNRVNHARPYLTDIVAWQPLPEPCKPPIISKQAQDLRDRESFFTE